MLVMGHLMDVHHRSMRSTQQIYALRRECTLVVSFAALTLDSCQIAVPEREREQGRWRGSREGARVSKREYEMT